MTVVLVVPLGQDETLDGNWPPERILCPRSHGFRESGVRTCLARGGVSKGRPAVERGVAAQPPPSTTCRG